MPNKKIVLDTNCLLASISRRSTAFPVWKGFQEGRYTLCVTNEILAEYEEMIARMASAEVATNVIRMIMGQQVRGLRLCRRSHLHRVGRFALQRPARHHIPPVAGAQAERVS